MARPTAVACVVTDVVMPHLSGPKLAERIWATHPMLPILFTSGYASDTTVASSASGRSAFVQKPCAPEALSGAIRQLLDVRD